MFRGLKAMVAAIAVGAVMFALSSTAEAQGRGGYAPGYRSYGGQHGSFHVRPYANYRPHVHLNPYVHRPYQDGVNHFHLRPYAAYRPHVHLNPYVHRPDYRYGW
jgi:hypothetical protein